MECQVEIARRNKEPTVRRRLVMLVSFAVVVAGCRGTPVGEVKGTVTFEGKAVSEGRVSFLDQKAGTGDEALLKSDGSFAIEKPLPVGDYKITIEPLIVRKQVDGKGPEVGVEKPAPDIPEKYRRIGTTELSATVVEGKNEVILKMKR